MKAAFSSYHPYVLLSYYVFSGILIMYYNHPLFLVTAFILLIFVNITHDKGNALKKWLWPLLVMGTIFIFLNPFLVSRGTHILFYFRGKQVTLEALIFGVTMSFALISIIILFVSFNLILNGNKFLYIFSKILPRSAFLVMLALRFIPLVRLRMSAIMEVQRLRGASIVTGPLKNRAKNGMAFLKILLTWSLEEAIQTADSMKSRGYGIGQKSAYMPWQFKKRDALILVILSFTFCFSLFAGFYGYGKIIIYPELGTLHLYVLDWLSYSGMILIIGLPILIEGRENLKWRN